MDGLSSSETEPGSAYGGIIGLWTAVQQVGYGNQKVTFILREFRREG